MEKSKLAKLANYNSKEESKGASNIDKAHSLKKAILTLVKELNIKNGSLKIFVHNGQPGERIEIQNKILTKY